MPVTDVDTHDLEYLSNEPVAGTRLSERLKVEALPPEEALRIALEIGTVLHRAHLLGKVHGRVSPAAVVLTDGGPRLLQPESVDAEAAAPYRSPEQVNEERVDWRSDVFSYGSLLYELVSGRRAFPGIGEEMEQAIVRRPAAALNSKQPIYAAMEGVIAGCMQKKPGSRRQRMQNAVIELKLAAQSASRNVSLPGGVARLRAVSAGAGAEIRQPDDTIRPVFRGPQSATAARPARRMLMLGLVALLMLAAAAAAALATRSLVRDHTPSPVVVFGIPAPQPAGYCDVPSISPDGRMLACTAPNESGQSTLWVRGLDEIAWSAVEDSEGAFAPFWSPDDRYVGFFAKGLMKRVELEHGSVKGKTEALLETAGNGGGATWNRNGKILFAPSQEGGLAVAASTGGKAQQLIAPRADHSETAYLWPHFLPDGNHFVFFVQTDLTETSGIALGSLDSKSWRFLFDSDTNAVYSPKANAAPSSKGYLLYVQDRNLRAREFNPATGEFGEMVRIRDGVGCVRSLALAPISVSETAMLIYENIDQPTRQLEWTDRTGKLIRTVGDAAQWGPPRVSPDGRQLVLSKPGTAPQTSELWLVAEDGSRSPFVSTPGVAVASPVWSPDGTRIAYASNQNGVYDIYVKPLKGGKEELLYRSSEVKFPTDWTADGYVLFGAISEGTGSDIWALSLKDHRAAPIVQTIHAEGYAVVSPDGKWMAYESDESGRNEVYVQPFEPGSSETKRRYRVSAEGGDIPFWTRGGAEVVFMTDSGHFMAATVHARNGAFECDRPQALFQVRPMPPFTNLYGVSPDGARFMINAPLERTHVSQPGMSGDIMVETSWTDIRQK